MIPIVPLFGVAPYASVTVGTFTDADVNVTCDGDSLSDSHYPAEAGVHAAMTLGVAGDFFFAGSRPQ